LAGSVAMFNSVHWQQFAGVWQYFCEHLQSAI